jgi:predicted nucleic-acid-binding Zn-ribbon protein
MSVTKFIPQPKTVQPRETQRPCLKCGCTQFREASRIGQTGGADSIMYECVECGEYRL